jgi:hypothetical protein
MGDTLRLGETEDDIQWRTDILTAIQLEKWDDAQLLLLTRQGRVAEAESRLYKQRETAIEAWKQRFQVLNDQEYVRLVRDVQRTTFDYVKSTIVESYLVGLHRFFNASINIMVKLATGLLFAAAAAFVHHLVAGQIDRLLADWLWQYVALVIFILVYKAVEKPLESVLHRVGGAIRQWGLRAEAQRAYIKGIIIEDEIASLRDFAKRADG